MAQLSTAEINNLPDSDFAYIESGGNLDESGKTTPRSLRHFVIRDASHVRDALARIAQGAKFGQQALPKVRAAAKKFGISVGKSMLSPYGEVKSFSLKLAAPPDDEGNFTGYAAVFGNVDNGHDLIEPGAFTKTIKERPEVPIFWGHDHDSIPIGISRHMVEDGKGLKVEGQLFADTSERAREVLGAMRGGAATGLSIGYNTIRRSFKNGVRHLQELALGEFSVTPSGFAMNPLAEVASVKWLGQYGTTEEVDCLLSVIGPLTDYLASEVEEGDTDDVERVQQVLPILLECLASELADVASSDVVDGSASDYSDTIESMRAPIELSIKRLQALLEGDAPADATHRIRRAAEDAAAPDVASTLRATIAAFKAA